MKDRGTILIGFFLMILGCAVHMGSLWYTWNTFAATVGIPPIGVKGALLLEALSWTIFPVQQSEYLEDPESFGRAMVRRLVISLAAAILSWISCHIM